MLKVSFNILWCIFFLYITSSLCDVKNQFHSSKFKVGIIGSGIAGLYSALILESLNIDFEILEADSRAGGRFHTYNFFPNMDPETCLGQAYFDLGATRFPSSWLFKRQFSEESYALIPYLNKRLKSDKRLKVIDYILNSKNNIWYLNGHRAFQSEVDHQSSDLFHVGESLGGNLPDKYAKQSPTSLLVQIIKPFIDKIERNYTQGMKYLTWFDKHTFRDYAINGPSGLPVQVLDYMAFNVLFRLGLTTVVLQLLPRQVSNVTWKAINGGSSKVIDAMVSLVGGKLFLNRKVNAIIPDGNGKLKVTTKSSSHKYDHIIITPTFPAIQSIDLSKCNLSFAKRKAIEVFHYLNSVKVGLLFVKRWWQDSLIMRGRPIFGGESNTDIPIESVHFPSNGLNCTEFPSALLVSYTLEDKASRLAGMSDANVERLALDNLSEMFSLGVRKFYTGKYIVYRWQSNIHTLGGFRVIDSGHLTTYVKEFLNPESNGRLHFGGDALGLFTGWSHDSLTNAYYAVLQILKQEKMSDKIEEVTSKWGKLEDKWSF